MATTTMTLDADDCEAVFTALEVSMGGLTDPRDVLEGLDLAEAYEDGVVKDYDDYISYLTLLAKRFRRAHLRISKKVSEGGPI